MVAIFGAYHSSVSAAASNVTERMQIPYLTGESSSPKLHTRGFEWFFRTGPHDGHYTRTMFDFIGDFEKAKGVKLATAAIIHEDTQFGVDSARVQVELAKEAGIEVLEKIAYRAKTTSLTSEVQRLKAADADILFPTSYTADALLLMRTMKELDYAPRIIIAQNAGFNDATFLETIGADSEGIISRSPFSMDMAAKIPLIAQLNDLYKQHNDDRDIFDPPIRSFVGALVLFEAINRAGSTEPGAIRDALRATSFPAGAIPMPWQEHRLRPGRPEQRREHRAHPGPGRGVLLDLSLRGGGTGGGVPVQAVVGALIGLDSSRHRHRYDCARFCTRHPGSAGILPATGRRPVMDDPQKARNCSGGLEARAPGKGATCLVGPRCSLAGLAYRRRGGGCRSKRRRARRSRAAVGCLALQRLRREVREP